MSKISNKKAMFIIHDVYAFKLSDNVSIEENSRLI